jgi:hypothetical protein
MKVGGDRMLEVIPGGAWYAVCVRHVKDIDTAASEVS